MARIDRRSRLALDESYRYYRHLESGEEPELFQLSRSLNNVASALSNAHTSEFKLTQQLWRRLQEALFDRYINSFAGTFVISDEQGNVVPLGKPWAEAGYVRFQPEGCRRNEDVASIEIRRLYPVTYDVLKNTWGFGSNRVEPRMFATAPQCSDGICAMRPMVLGGERLQAESNEGKRIAYQRWWELYWQAYCTNSKQQRSELYRSMMQIESVWGDLYY